MIWVRPPLLLKAFYGKAVCWRIPVKSKNIYLSFDDGPVPEVTKRVLDILDEYNAKSTFFMIGENIERNPDIFSDVVKRGHSVGNHTFNHLNGWKTSKSDYLDSIKKCESLTASSLFRPPYGRMLPSVINSIKGEYRIIMWSVLSYDFDKNISPEQCVRNITKFTGNGSIVVFHDSKKAEKNVLYTLPRVLEYFSLKGYQFSSIPSH
jgi:peptidoglycan/xylan/chitin deacetylase (PgdA/CDA1 family)